MGSIKLFWIFWVFLSMLKTKLFEYIDLRLPWLFGGLYAKSWRHCRLWEEIQPSKFGTTKHWCHSQMLHFYLPPSTNTNILKILKMYYPPGPRRQYTKNVWRIIKFMIKLVCKSPPIFESILNNAVFMITFPSSSASSSYIRQFSASLVKLFRILAHSAY